MATNGKTVLLLDAAGENVYCSADAGDTWNGPYSTGTSRVTLSVVNGEYWLAGKLSRASAEGKQWRDLPTAVPSGKIVGSEQGTLINVDRKRYSILRSADCGETWQEVYTFEPETEHVHGAQGLRGITIGYTTPEPIKLPAR